MSLVGPRPKNAYDLPAPVRRPVAIPPLPYDCGWCKATLRTQVDFLLHNCFSRFDQLGDRRTRVRL